MTATTSWPGSRPANAHLRVEESLIRIGPFDPSFGADATISLLRRGRFTALLGAKHEALFGILPTLAQRDVAIPDEVSVVGFEDATFFQYWNPSITVVDTQPAELGRKAFALPYRQMKRQGIALQPSVVISPARLRVRASSAQLVAGSGKS